MVPAARGPPPPLGASFRCAKDAESLGQTPSGDRGVPQPPEDARTAGVLENLLLFANVEKIRDICIKNSSSS